MVLTCFKGSILMYSTTMTPSGRLGYGYRPEKEHSYGKLPFLGGRSADHLKMGHLNYSKL